MANAADTRAGARPYRVKRHGHLRVQACYLSALVTIISRRYFATSLRRAALRMR
jgi:hypothetical protein